jgi:hypothetical protein
MNPVSLPKAQVSTDTVQLLEKAAEYTQALNDMITSNPSAESWKVDVEGTALYGLDLRAATQVAAAFDRSEDFGAAVTEGRLGQIVVVRKGQSPYDAQ